jgi:NAD-dependent deacetylase
MAVASIYAFRLNPERFFEWFRPLGKTLLESKPNPAHIALAKLEEAGLLKAVITQNIDGLHQKAGSKRVLEIHGHIREAECIICRRSYPTESFLHNYLELGEIPRCQCGGILKPKVILFGEPLPKWVFLEAVGEAQRCDAMIIAGSSLEVYPAAELPTLAYQNGAKLIVVNLQSTYADSIADVVIREDVAVALPAIAEKCLERS